MVSLFSLELASSFDCDLVLRVLLYHTYLKLCVTFCYIRTPFALTSILFSSSSHIYIHIHTKIKSSSQTKPKQPSKWHPPTPETLPTAPPKKSEKQPAKAVSHLTAQASLHRPQPATTLVTSPTDLPKKFEKSLARVDKLEPLNLRTLPLPQEMATQATSPTDRRRR